MFWDKKIYQLEKGRRQTVPRDQHSFSRKGTVLHRVIGLWMAELNRHASVRCRTQHLTDWAESSSCQSQQISTVDPAYFQLVQCAKLEKCFLSPQRKKPKTAHAIWRNQLEKKKRNCNLHLWLRGRLHWLPRLYDNVSSLHTHRHTHRGWRTHIRIFFIHRRTRAETEGDFLSQPNSKWLHPNTSQWTSFLRIGASRNDCLCAGAFIWHT